jgi:hypothetical protein
MDLLEYAQQLVSRGQTNPQVQAHTAYLQTLIQSETPRPKAEIKATAPNNSQNNHKNPNLNVFYLVGGLVLFGMAILAIGYWLGKRKKAAQIDELQEL